MRRTPGGLLPLATAIALYPGLARARAAGARPVPLAEGASASADAGVGPRLWPFPAGKVRAPWSRWTFVVEHSGSLPPDREVKAALPALLRSPGAEGADGPSLEIVHVESPEFKPPGPILIKSFGRGLSAADAQRAGATKRATAIVVRARTGPEARALLIATQKAAVQLARSRSGFIYDDGTREIFTPDAFEKRRLGAGALDVRKHVTAHAYRSGELIRLVTLGMEKFGLPDLTVEESSGGAEISLMVNLAAQLLLDGAEISSQGILSLDLDRIRDPVIRKEMTGNLLEGARRHAEVTALQGRRDEGDPENALLELWFGEPAQEKQAEAAARIWGSHDALVLARNDDELEKESRREREKAIREIKPRFQRGELDDRHLMIKLPFREDGNTEWMWVEVVRWEGSEIRGILANTPMRVHGLRAGAQVAGSEDELFDFILHSADGGTEGNSTAPLLQR